MKNRSHRKALQNIGSVFGLATHIDGTITLDETARIDGRITGNLLQSDGDDRWLIIGAKAEVRGDIRAQNVSVAGKVLGNIAATGSVELLEGCEVRGNITHQSITVEPGASVHGQLTAREGSGDLPPTTST